MKNQSFLQLIAIIIMISAIGVVVSIWQPWKTHTRTVETSAEGKIKAAPDVAKITGGIEVKKPTANEAQAEASAIIAKIIEAVKAKGIEEKDIKTENLTTLPSYNYSNNKSEIDGYTSQATITVTLREITKGQEIADLVTKNGGTNVYGPSLTFSDERLEELKKQAREEAIKNARKKADQLAQASDANVGKVVKITETNGSGAIPYYLGEIATDSQKGIPSRTIMPGESEVSVTVSVTFSIK